MMGWDMLPEGVVKKIISGGTGDLSSFPDSSKVWFHFRTFIVKENGERQMLDDSRASKEPFELLIGKQFKLDIWEKLVKTMRLNEVAEFICQPYHVGSYPVVSKSLRGMWSKDNHKHSHDHKHEHKHQCGFAALSEGLGYDDLNEYVKKPCPLAFQIELIKIEKPGEYERDLWSISLDEKLKLIPKWKEEGNQFYKDNDYANACKKYSDALGSLEQITTREKPGSDEWLEIEKMKIPFLLNFAQCMIKTKEFYKAIEHLTTVIEKDASNVKGYFRRASAYHSVFSLAEAKADYRKAKQLDPSLTKTIDNEISKIEKDEVLKNKEDRNKYKNAFKSS